MASKELSDTHLTKSLGSGNVPAILLEIRPALSEGRFPLFVSEGNSRGKFERIRHSGYLHKGLRSFRKGVCDSKSASLFVFGHSLADNDYHILKQIEKGKIESVYISIYGRPATPENQAIMARAERIRTARSARHPLNIEFFDAASAAVWGD